MSNLPAKSVTIVLYGCKLCPNDLKANKFDRLLKKGDVQSNWRSSLEYHAQEAHPEIGDWQSLQIKVKVGKASRTVTSSEDRDAGGQQSDKGNDIIVVRKAANQVQCHGQSGDSAVDTRPRKRTKSTNTRTSIQGR